MSYLQSSDFLLLEALGAYYPLSPEEQKYKHKMLNLLDKHSESCFQRTLLHAHFTASAWVIDPIAEKALLTHHKKLNKWLQIGGHADGDQHLIRVAAKELHEESGLLNFQSISHEIFDIDIHVIPAREKEPVHEHFDVRFLFEASTDEILTPNHESKAMKWLSWSEINKSFENASIQRMNKKAIEMFTNSVTESE